MNVCTHIHKRFQSHTCQWIYGIDKCVRSCSNNSKPLPAVNSAQRIHFYCCMSYHLYTHTPGFVVFVMKILCSIRLAYRGLCNPIYFGWSDICKATKPTWQNIGVLLSHCGVEQSTSWHSNSHPPTPNITTNRSYFYHHICIHTDRYQHTQVAHMHRQTHTNPYTDIVFTDYYYNVY